jgi:two-component system chemotaxis response regulator CheY
VERTVLVVDDDKGLQESLQSLLEMEGYTVAIAGDGLEALQKLGNFNPSVILLDLMMPRMNGFEFIQELQLRGHRAKVPIIILTADGRARQKAAQVGAEGYLAKPFDILALLEEMDRVT